MELRSRSSSPSPSRSLSPSLPLSRSLARNRFVNRADMCVLLFDPHKLDISGEMASVLEAFEGNEAKARVVLNKADSVPLGEMIKARARRALARRRVRDCGIDYRSSVYPCERHPGARAVARGACPLHPSCSRLPSALVLSLIYNETAFFGLKRGRELGARGLVVDLAAAAAQSRRQQLEVAAERRRDVEREARLARAAAAAVG